MKIPHPGELRQLVEICCTVHEINENGFPVETEQVVCQVWAKAEDCDSRYFTSGDKENTERGIWFTIRWRNDVRPGMWVLWNGQKQIITEICEYDFKWASLFSRARGRPLRRMQLRRSSIWFTPPRPMRTSIGTMQTVVTAFTFT